MHKAQVTIVADSTAKHGKRITTVQTRYWRGIHSELMTHRVFSRNAGSSRARPTKAIRKQVWSDPWGPLKWGLNEPGMQANTEASSFKQKLGRFVWRGAAKAAAVASWTLEKLGFHKQICNRILEPFTYIDVLITATEWENFFQLRIHPDADPTIYDLAVHIKAAMIRSTPKHIGPGWWHLPYADSKEDYQAARAYCKKGRLTRDEPTAHEILRTLLSMSAARCARISYKAFDGTVNIKKDMELVAQLMTFPLHASPFEHQARPLPPTELGGYNFYGMPYEWSNLVGWLQYRKILPNEWKPG